MIELIDQKYFIPFVVFAFVVFNTLLRNRIEKKSRTYALNCLALITVSILIARNPNHFLVYSIGALCLTVFINNVLIDGRGIDSVNLGNGKGVVFTNTEFKVISNTLARVESSTGLFNELLAQLSTDRDVYVNTDYFTLCLNHLNAFKLDECIKVIKFIAGDDPLINKAKRKRLNNNQRIINSKEKQLYSTYIQVEQSVLYIRSTQELTAATITQFDSILKLFHVLKSITNEDN